MRALLAALLVVAGCGGGMPATPTPEPSVEYKLAVIHGDGDHDPAIEREFAQVLDAVQEGGQICAAEPDRERAADIIVAGWEASGKGDTLLEWARAVASLCQ
jgi:hypothetical protein